MIDQIMMEDESVKNNKWWFIVGIGIKKKK